MKDIVTLFELQDIFYEFYIVNENFITSFHL